MLTYPKTETELLQRIDQIKSVSIDRLFREENGSLLMLDDLDILFQDHREDDESLARMIWGLDKPVMVGRFTAATESFQRIVFVIAAQTVGVKLKREIIDLVQAIQVTLDVPMLVMTTRTYFDELNTAFSGEETKMVRLGDDIIETILKEIKEEDLVILSSMHSTNRFVPGEETVPVGLKNGFSGSLVIFHLP